MQELKLLPLYPKINENDYISECELLDKGIKDTNIKNIGIVAQYGAGKSSFLTTFENSRIKKKRTKLKFLNISLASFNSGKEGVSEVEEGNEKIVNDINNTIEKSILQQMLYRKEQKDLPNSHIRRINNASSAKRCCFWFLLFSAAIAVAAFALFGLNFNGVQIFNFPKCQIAYPIIGTVGFLVFLSLLVCTIRISKISFKDLEIELTKDKKESLLNKFLDEVIYFFQKTKYNVVIFEDLDRFNNVNIFIKLRELNSILNANNVVRAKCGKITFLYAARNEIFKDAKERVKFFDLIITITPVLSILNVKDKIIESLKECGLGDDWLPKSFITDISYYIKDMRILNCIINDCVAFCKAGRLSKISGDDENYKHIQLFVLMAYKNLHPKEFAEFEYGKGELKELIDYAKLAIKQEIKNVNSEIDRNNKAIAVYKKRTSLNNTDREELKKLNSANKELYRKKSLYSGAISYVALNSDAVFKVQRVREVLKMAISYGYINDNFKNYLFRRDNAFMSENVEKYLGIVLNRQEPVYDIKLDNINLLADEMSADKFKVKSILNFDMVNYIFDNLDSRQDQLDSLKLLLLSGDKIILDFIGEYICNAESYSKNFIKFIVSEFDNLFQFISDCDELEDEFVDFLKYVLLNCTVSEIRNQSDIGVFKRYLQDDKDFVTRLYDFRNKLDFLREQGFIVDNLKDYEFDNRTLNEIDRSRIWKVNYENVIYITTRLFNHSKEKIEDGGISLIKSLPRSETANYILEDIKNYVGNIMLKAKSLTLKEPDFRALVTNSKISLSDRYEIIKKQSNKMVYPTSKIENEIMECLLNNNKIEVKSANLPILLRDYPALIDNIAQYVYLNHEEFKDRAVFGKELSIGLINSTNRIDGKLLVEYFLNQVTGAFTDILKITNDEALTFILEHLERGMEDNEVNYIFKDEFVSAPMYFIKHYNYLNFLHRNQVNKRFILLCLTNEVKREVRQQIYKEQEVNVEEYGLDIAKNILEDICSNKYSVSDKLYESLTKLEIDNRALFLSQINDMPREKLFERLKLLDEKFCKLAEKGLLEIESDELKDEIIKALLDKNLIGKIDLRGRNKGKHKLFIIGEKDAA